MPEDSYHRMILQFDFHVIIVKWKLIWDDPTDML